MEKLLDEIESYWSTRTEGYSEVNHKELAGTQKNAWLKVLTSQFPDKPKEEIRILDIGTGPGFFPVILAEAGYHVDAVDYTEGMLEKAKENAGDLCRNIRDVYKRQEQVHPDIVNAVRCLRANRKEKDDNLAVEQAYVQISGFESQRTFNRVFRERYRMTPREYRTLYKEKYLREEQT